MSSALVNELVEKLAGLPDDLQKKVLEYVDTLAVSRLSGAPGKELLRFAGTVSVEDAELMRSAIEAGCEQVDANEW